MTDPLSSPRQPAPDGQPFARPALAVQLSDALRELILEGALKGGDKIREKELTERFGVSRTPLREALKILASDGLVELIPNRGAIVSEQSPEELQDAFPVLAALEGLAGRLAAERATDAEIDRIVQMTGDLRATLERAQRPAYFEINQKIHAAILAAGRCETLLKTHATIASRVHRARYQANLTRTRWEAALDEHERIADALRARDADRVGKLLEAHMIAKLAAILNAMSSKAARGPEDSADHP